LAVEPILAVQGKTIGPKVVLGRGGGEIWRRNVKQGGDWCKAGGLLALRAQLLGQGWYLKGHVRGGEKKTVKQGVNLSKV